jgi:hypothetical protein
MIAVAVVCAAAAIFWWRTTGSGSLTPGPLLWQPPTAVEAGVYQLSTVTYGGQDISDPQPPNAPPIVLESIHLRRVVGGAKLIRISVAAIGVDTPRGVSGFQDYYPPHETLHSPEGFHIPAGGSVQVQVVVGMVAPRRADWSGFPGFVIRYRIGRHQYVVSTESAFQLCTLPRDGCSRTDRSPAQEFGKYWTTG